MYSRSRFAEVEQASGRWLGDGRLVVREHIEHGLDSFPATLRMLFAGGHHGKRLLSVS